MVGVELHDDAARANIDRADPSWESIELLQGDVCDPDLPARVQEHVPRDAVCLVIEDTLHEYATTRAALDGFSHFVPEGGWFVVEDGCVDDEQLRWRVGRVACCRRSPTGWAPTPGPRSRCVVTWNSTG